MGWNVSFGTDIDVLAGENISFKVLRLGAEPLSLKINHPEFGEIGLLVNDDITDADHHYWKRHAPFLFPIVGGLIDDKSETSDGKTIKLPGHGFARNTVFEVVESGSNETSCWIEYHIDTTMITDEYVYPWACSLNIRYTLSKNSLKTDLIVKNDSNNAMKFQLGWHPGFKAPVIEGKGSRSECEVLLPKGEAPLLQVAGKDSYLTGKREKKALGGRYLFTETELENTIVLDMETISDRWCALYDPHSKIKTTLTFHDLPHLGIWGLKDSPYICIEPWQGCDDHVEQEKFDQKFGIATLEAGTTGTHTITIDLEY